MKQKFYQLSQQCLNDIMNGNDISLEVDGKDIPMNDFVKKIMFGMIDGTVGTLRDVNKDWKSVKLILNR